MQPLEKTLRHKVEAASRRFPEPGYFHPETPIANLSGNLPHWRQEAVTYFVTFRLADSMPQQRLAQWLSEQQEWIRHYPEPHDDATRQEYYRLFPQRFQDWLDQSEGCCVLELPQVKRLVEQALQHFDGQRYDLDEYVVMPNHVHVVVTPQHGYHLSEILHAWKSFTAHEILKVAAASRRLHASAQNLGWVSPTVWQKESFDHIVRSPAQLERIRHYIRENPARAGLVQPR